MIIRSVEDIKHSSREVISEGWTSRRLLLDEDNMGFSFHETIIHSGAELRMHYKHHLEAVLCIEGEGLLIDIESSHEYKITPGVMYALSANERHILRSKNGMRVVCVFNPPLTGREVHDAEGAYPKSKDIP